MTSSMNIHRIKKIDAQLMSANGHKWTELSFTDDQGNRFSLAVHSGGDWIPIDGADHINRVTQPIEVLA